MGPRHTDVAVFFSKFVSHYPLVSIKLFWKHVTIKYKICFLLRVFVLEVSFHCRSLLFTLKYIFVATMSKRLPDIPFFVPK